MVHVHSTPLILISLNLHPCTGTGKPLASPIKGGVTVVTADVKLVGDLMVKMMYSVLLAAFIFFTLTIEPAVLHTWLKIAVEMNIQKNVVAGRMNFFMSIILGNDFFDSGSGFHGIIVVSLSCACIPLVIIL